MKKILSTVILLVLSILGLSAQNSIKVQVPNMVAVDEQFNVTFIVEGEHTPSSFDWAPGDDFQLVWGPQKGSSTSISMINGKTTKSSQVTYTYVLLPKKKGTFNLPEARATVKGNEIRSRATSIEVVSSGSSTSQSSQSGSGSSNSSSSSSSQAVTSGNISSKDLFMRISFSSTDVVVGEPVTATIKLYQRVNIAGFEDVKFPTFNGFWSQELETPTNIDFHRENVNDMIYNAAVLRSYVLIPQQAGDIRIDPAELTCLVNVRNATSSSNSIFDSFFQDSYKTIRKKVTTDARTLHVRKLPAGAPASFGGGVGNFTIKAELSKDSLRTHDAASLVVTVTGKGNVSLLEAPKVQFPSDFDVYDVKSTENTDKSTGKTSGSKTFEFPFIPRSYGQFEIPAIEYSYYDIKSGKYVTLTTQPITMNVAKGNESEASAGGQIMSASNKKDVKDLGTDIRFIQTKEPSFKSTGSFFLGSGAFWAILAVIIAAIAGAWFALRKYAAVRADVVGTKNRKATKMAQKRLSLAGTYLRNGLPTAFYEELHKALLGFISDKLNMDLADMSKDNIASALIDSGVDESLASQFTQLLDECEYARYAPAAGNEAMSAHYQTAVNVISFIDASMKGKKKSTGSAAGKGAVTALLLLMMLPGVKASAADASVDTLWAKASAAYASGLWDSAVSSWKAIEDKGYESPVLYYNIGNAYYKSGDLAHAILGYERALKLDPSYKDARINLEFVNNQIQDKIETVPEFFLKTWVRTVGWKLSSNAWAGLFLFLLLAAGVLLLMFLLGGSGAMRKTGFYGAIVAFVLSLCCLGFSISQKSAYFRTEGAIITNAVSSAKSSPGTSDAAKDLFVLHEGTKVRIIDAVGEWSNIELTDGRQGWITNSDMEEI